jgi:hypothetical protein
MTQRATSPMILALLVTTLGFATLIFAQEAASPPLVYGAYYAGTLFALYLGVRLLLRGIRRYVRSPKLLELLTFALGSIISAVWIGRFRENRVTPAPKHGR